MSSQNDQGRIILAFDHDPASLSALSERLKAEGVAMLTNIHGLAALPQIIDHSSDLLLLNLNLPDIDSIDLCRLLSTTESTRHLPIILIADLDSSPARLLAGLTAGAVDYIIKPIHLEKAWLRLKIHLETNSYPRPSTELNRSISAETLNQIKRHLAHELTNPLGIMMGYTDYLLESIIEDNGEALSKGEFLYILTQLKQAASKAVDRVENLLGI